MELGGVGPASPVVLEDQVIVGVDQGQILSISLDGKERKWVFEGIEEKAMVYSTPAVADGDYCGRGSGSTTARTERQRWERDLEIPIQGGF